jgi:amino acid permease
MLMNGRFVWVATLVAATAVGAGLFSLPYVFLRAGYFTGILYLAGIAMFLSFTHSIYYRVLEENRGAKRLLGLTAKYFGNGGRILGVAIIIGGLILTLVVYLILAGEFSELIRPGTKVWGTFLFWLAGSLPIILGLRRLLFSEFLGAMMMVLIIGLVFFGAWGKGLPKLVWVNWQEVFLPFGPVLFSLAAWTAVEPAFDYSKRTRQAPDSSRRAMTLGIYLAAFLYLLFVLGILGTVSTVTPDTISGLGEWPAWKFVLLVILGLFAIWTSYIPIGLEIKNSLLYDLGWPRFAAAATVFLLPPALLLFGLGDFFKVLGLAGGVFLGLEYLLILMVGKRALALSVRERLGVNLLIVVFVLGAVYEIYYFFR